MIDSGADVETIAKAMQRPEETPKSAIDWNQEQHLETDFTKQPAMDFRIEADIVDQKPTQRMFGTPVYDRNGDMRCRCCGEVVGRTVSNSGEGIAVCSNIGCNANGFAYAEGSFIRNPHRVQS